MRRETRRKGAALWACAACRRQQFKVGSLAKPCRAGDGCDNLSPPLGKRERFRAIMQGVRGIFRRPLREMGFQIFSGKVIATVERVSPTEIVIRWTGHYSDTRSPFQQGSSKSTSLS